jgi:nucleoside diphosphate kinase
MSGLMYPEYKMSAGSPVYLEIINFIAAGTTPEAVTHFQPSVEAQRRVAGRADSRCAQVTLL